MGVLLQAPWQEIREAGCLTGTDYSFKQQKHLLSLSLSILPSFFLEVPLTMLSPQYLSLSGWLKLYEASCGAASQVSSVWYRAREELSCDACMGTFALTKYRIRVYLSALVYK